MADIHHGFFITVEGIDGSGKSSHTEAMAQWLRSQGHTVQLTREPGGTELAEALRALMLERPMDAMTEVLLAFAARRDHLARVIEPALAAGHTVLCDRFTDSTFAYQGAGRGVDAGLLVQLEAWVQAGRQPDLTLWFDVSPAVAAQRRSAVRAPDRFEAQDLDFFARVRSGYEARVHQSPARFARIDASCAPTVVWAQVRAALQGLARPA